MSTLWDLVGEKVIDSRDLVSRAREIEYELEDLDGAAADRAAAADELRSELDAINEIVDELDGYSAGDARFGITLVHDEYFEEYAQEFAEDIGAIDRNPRWPYEHIDWKAAAEALQMDYTSVSIGTEEYWFR